MLSQPQIRQYHDDGYVLVGGIFTDAELDGMETAFDGIIARRSASRAPMDATWNGDWKDSQPAMAIVHCSDLQAYSADWGRVLLHDRFTESMADLIGPNVQLHHTKLFQKPPEHGSAFPMHQDYPYFPHQRHTMMAAIIHLTDSTEAMGCVRVMPGSHKLGPLETTSSGTADASYLDPARYPIKDGTPCPAKRGDVLFFSYLTIHGSDINTSDRARKTVLVQVRDPDDGPTEDVHRSHGQGMMLRGVDPLNGRPFAYGTPGDWDHRSTG